MVFNNVNIKGSGVALPSNIFLNNSIINGIDTTDEWIKEKLGIEERRVASESETVSTLGYSAAINAMKDAGIDKEDLDLIIVATSSPEKISPSTGIQSVGHRPLGLPTARLFFYGRIRGHHWRGSNHQNDGGERRSTRH